MDSEQRTALVGWAARSAIAASLGALLASLADCSSSDSGGAFGSGGSFGAQDASANAGFGGAGGTLNLGSGGTSGTGGTPPPPPEKELESTYRSPVATGRFVWTANPDSGRVALVDAETLEVKTAEAGLTPTYLAAVSSTATTGAAIVLNLGSHDATLLRADSGTGKLVQKNLPTHTGANAWSISGSGRWAIAWTDSALAKNPDPTESFQDVTVLDLTSGQEKSVRLSVGYRPSSVAFSGDEGLAFAVTEPGISVIDLAGATGPEVQALIELSSDPLDDPAARDVTLTPDGAYALVRHDDSSIVTVVTLADGTRTDVELTTAVTDLDLSDDGTRAVAVLRDTAEVAVLPIPGIVADPTSFISVAIDGELFGSVSLSPGAQVGLLYTNAVPNDHLTLLDLSPGGNLAFRTVSVKSPVRAVFPSGDSAHAITLQDPGAGSVKAGAFSIVPTTVVRAPKIVGTDAPPTAVAVFPGPLSDRAIVTVRDDALKRYGAYLLRMPSLQVDYLQLASAPIATGMVPSARKAFVAQKHPDGRITFIDLDTGAARTLTGFELGANVIDH